MRYKGNSGSNECDPGEKGLLSVMADTADNNGPVYFVDLERGIVDR